jgi:uncharacterized protein YtpQ (UPF0354 family)
MRIFGRRSPDVTEMFEGELRKRGLAFEVDKDSGRHAIEVNGCRILISLDNLRRDFAKDRDVTRISRFVDAVVASARDAEPDFSTDRLYWCLESNDYEEPADFRFRVSDRLDRVLVHLSPDERLVTWVTPDTLTSMSISQSNAEARAFENLAQVLRKATIESEHIDGVKLCFVNTPLPFKASLILAPNLREVMEPVVGWPLMAVVPDRNFLYLWAARYKDFVQRLGSVVVREYLQASYPLTTEVFEITDDGCRTAGEFPTNAG